MKISLYYTVKDRYNKRLGSILSYVTLKTKSCIPAVISHAMINGFEGTGVLFMKGIYRIHL